MASQRIQELRKRLTAAKEKAIQSSRTMDDGGSLDLDNVAWDEVGALQLELRAIEKEEIENAERTRTTQASIKKSESAEPESKSRIKVESPNAPSVHQPLRQYFQTSKADANALRLQKGRDAYDDALAGPAASHSPKKLIIDLDDDARRTFLNFSGIRCRGKGWEMWDFKISEWVAWDMDQADDSAPSLLWDYAKKVLSIIYFCTHQCRVKDLEMYIPKQIYLQVYSLGDWTYLLDERRSILHGRVLTQQVKRHILPLWRGSLGYPAMPFDAENDTEADKAERVSFFEKQAINDEEALQMFVGSVGDSMNWQRIVKKETEEDVAAWRWAVKSLAAAANLVHELGYEDKDGAQLGRNKFSTLRNKLWELVPVDQRELAPHHSTIAILARISREEAPKQSNKRKRDPEPIVAAPARKSRVDSEGRIFVDLISDDET